MDDLEIKALNNTDLVPYDLLLLADPSKVNIDKYIFDSLIYTAEKAGPLIGFYSEMPWTKRKPAGLKK